ncbi:maintenance of mitochondrial structure and function-domain-containing protein [Cladochytrium replicatum]|nr:maintenance of mitochondrial structure and function-domain-containing protein [Cladochytrium replicatum]
MATAMETDQSKVVGDVPSSSGLNITLHPLVILNISEHFTRRKMQLGASNIQVFGALLGSQTGRDVEIHNSYELPFESVDSLPVISKKYFVTKQEQFKQVFPQLDFLGWYCTGPKPTQAELNVHQQMLEFNESPLFLQLNSTGAVTAKELPIAMYESVIDIVNGQPRTIFLKTNYKIETGEAERIAIDHVAHAATADAEEGSALIAHLVSQKNAIGMLHARIKIINQYLIDVEKGLIPRDHNVLRQISSLCNRLPTADSAEFTNEFLTDYNDVLLMSHLATITKGINGMNELIDRFNITSERRGGPRAHMQTRGQHIFG